MAEKNDSEIGGVVIDITGIPAIATTVREMTGALDQFVNIVFKAALLAQDLLDSESVATSEECREAFLSITEVNELAYQFINKIDYLNYHFQTPDFKCEVENMKSKKNHQQLLNTLSKTTKTMSDAEEIYKNLKDKCSKIATNCSKAEQFCRNKANTARRDSNITKGIGGAASGTALALGTAGTVGLGISIVAGFATCGIGTLVGLGITGAVVGTVSVVGIGAGTGGAIVTHIMASKFMKAEETFKEFTQQFDDLCRYAIKVHSFTENVSTSLKQMQTFVEGIQLYGYDCHDMSRCQDELLRLHQVAIDMHRKTSSIKERLQCEKSKLAEKIPKLFSAD